jgi:hypothetical protein
MKIYNTIEELQKDIVDDTLSIDGDININFDLDMPKLVIKAQRIWARNINVNNIDAYNIDAENINAKDIDAHNINAWRIWAWNIRARIIKAQDIKAWDISAFSIKAKNISYHSCCYTKCNLICDSIKSLYAKGKHWSIEGKVIINGKEQTQ